jgi:Rrf2 family protein
LNSRPADYESAALPLSYLGNILARRQVLRLEVVKITPPVEKKKHKLGHKMLSKKCKYAIHALVHMAKGPDEKYLIRDISDACRIPKKFLEGILLDLKHAGILGSKQGKGGGYTLRRSPKDVNLAEVVRLFDGAIAAVPCATYKYYERCNECEDEETCSIRHAFMEVRNSTVEMLKRDTLDKLVRNELKLRSSAKRRSGRKARSTK